MSPATAPPDDDAPAKSYDAVLLKRLLLYLRPYVPQVLGSFVLIALMSGLDLVGPYLTKVAIDEHIAQRDAAGLLPLAVVSALGFVLADQVPDGGLYAEAFAGGAVLTMLANSMMPEAFQHGGQTVGLLTVLGYLAAGALAVAQ